MKGIEFSKARIVAMENKIANGNVTSRIKCAAVRRQAPDLEPAVAAVQ